MTQKINHVSFGVFLGLSGSCSVFHPRILIRSVQIWIGAKCAVDKGQ